MFMAVANYPVSGAGNFRVQEDPKVYMTKEEYWNELSEEDQRQFQFMAQAAMTVFQEIGFQEVMAASFDQYLEEKWPTQLSNTTSTSMV